MEKSFICLASASPRRRQLLEQIGVPFRVQASTVSEARLADELPAAYVVRVAADKAEQVWSGSDPGEAVAVLAADTAVVVEGRILGKPRDESDAMTMLGQLSGTSHTVLTAIALRWQSGADHAVAKSEVRFRTTTEAERRAYCHSGEPFGKAGAYAIQGLGAVFVEHLTGSYSTVMGLPLFETARMLGRFGFPGWLTEGVSGA